MQIFMCSQLIRKTNLRFREISGNLLAPRPPTEPAQVWGQCLLVEGGGVSPSSFLDPPLPVSASKALPPPLPKCRPNTCGTERRVVESTGSDQGPTTLKLLSLGPDRSLLRGHPVRRMVLAASLVSAHQMPPFMTIMEVQKLQKSLEAKLPWDRNLLLAQMKDSSQSQTVVCGAHHRRLFAFLCFL